MFTRRTFLAGAAGLALAGRAQAEAFRAFSQDVWPPTGSSSAFVAWMSANRGEDPTLLAARYARFQQVHSIGDLYTQRELRGFLMTPREEFVLPEDRDQAYVGHYLDIGFGVTITPPGTCSRMTSTLVLKNGERVLEIGTGSGFQSAFLSYLTNDIYTIEIIPELAQRTRGVYDKLIAKGYSEFSAIKTRTADGYYGWEEAAPFDKIIVTCGIDHIPPPLLQQLKPNGVMVIPVGPPGAQHVIKVVKKQGSDGQMTAARSDIFGGKIIPFVPLSGGHQPDG